MGCPGGCIPEVVLTRLCVGCPFLEGCCEGCLPGCDVERGCLAGCLQGGLFVACRFGGCGRVCLGGSLRVTGCGHGLLGRWLAGKKRIMLPLELEGCFLHNHSGYVDLVISEKGRFLCSFTIHLFPKIPGSLLLGQ